MKFSLFFSILFAFANLSYTTTISCLFMELNGEPHLHDKSQEWVKNWYAFSLEGDTVIITQCSGYKESNWLQSSGSLDESIEEIAHKTFKPNEQALALPKKALFAFHALDDSSQIVTFPTKRAPSMLKTPLILRNNWSAQVQLDEQHIAVKALGKRRSDKRLLAGSLALVAIHEKDTTILMPPMAEELFKKQELLWIGDLDGDEHLDCLVKRTRHTGEVYLHLHVGKANRSHDIDPDYPYQVYSAGIEDYMSIGKHRKQKHPLKKISSFGEKAFTLKSSVWNKTYGEVRGDALPKTLLDYQLKLNDEKVRFTFDYVPRYRSNESSYNIFYGPSPAHITVHYRGKRQALVDLGSSDGDPVRVQIDTIDNKMAIKIDYMPHYNNSFVIYWLWSEEQRRFVRYMQYHAQGC